MVGAVWKRAIRFFANALAARRRGPHSWPSNGVQRLKRHLSPACERRAGLRGKMPPASSAVGGSAVPNIKGMNTAKVGPDPGGLSGPTPEWDNPEVSGAGVGSGAGARRTSGAGKAPASRGGSSGVGASGATADGVRTRTAVESDSKSPGFGAAAKLDDKEMARISAIYAERAEVSARRANPQATALLRRRAVAATAAAADTVHQPRRL